MSRVEQSTITMPVAELGPDNPLPPLSRPRLITEPAGQDFSYGRPATLLPYTVQDGYTRNLVDTTVNTAVVENDFIRAEFLLGYGGRMWSLYDKRRRRELLHRNPILQPANLALRNAWFAGGVEWNLGTTGHTALTCAPMHAATVALPDGRRLLRLWEFERLRELVYQLDIWAHEATLCVRVRIVNPNDHEVPVYWWSNIAVPQRPGTAVHAPATEAWRLGHDGVLRLVPTPKDLDFEHSVDFFYDIPAGRQPWIAAVDAEGVGLLHTSSPRLRGRKLFLWGHSTGGQRWQEWLSPPGHPYLEIQAGLARTQLEHLPMPARQEWSWLETYRLATLGDDFSPPLPDFEPAWADLPVAQRLHKGSGWGALERRIRDGDGFDLPGTPFADDTLGRDQVSWLSLLETGAMPAPAARLAPASYQVGRRWLGLLERSAPNWFTLVHLGVARWHAGLADEATRAWEASFDDDANPWALRNLAVAEPDTAVDRLRKAHAMVPGMRALAVEAIQAMLAAGKPAEALTFIDRLLPALRAQGRIRLLECRAALDAGRLDRAARLVDTGIVVDDLREGEDSLEELWFIYHDRRGSTPRPQLPCLYDFRTGASS